MLPLFSQPRSARSTTQASCRLGGAAGLLVLALLLVGGPQQPVWSGVRFENCTTAADGSISCDTVPTGNTLIDDETARYGLFQNASPGWNEFDPYEGYNEDFGDPGF